MALIEIDGLPFLAWWIGNHGELLVITRWYSCLNTFDHGTCVVYPSRCSRYPADAFRNLHLVQVWTIIQEMQNVGVTGTADWR